MNLDSLKSDHIGLCVSGGLDSRTVAKRLRQEGLKVTCFTADLAQPDEVNIEAIRDKMAPCGVETVIVDLKKDMAHETMRLLKSLARYDGGYWNTTGLARAVTVRGLLGAMQERGITVLAHGATGRGNDQVRFERYTAMLAPHIRVYAPWRDPQLLAEFPGRTQMAQYLHSFGIPAPVGTKKKYSTDANLAGLSHEAEDLEHLDTPVTIVDPIMGVWPQQAPDQPETVTVSFKQGMPVLMNGEALSPLELLQRANVLGGRNGVWMKNALENRIVGTKSRGVYEAPGLELLGFCLEQLYQATLDKRSTALFRYLSQLVADHIYDGRYFEPSTQVALQAIDELARFATGTISVSLYKGNCHLLSITDVAGSLYNEADSSMEESNGLNPVSSQGFVDIQRVEAVALSKAGQIWGGKPVGL